MRSHSRVLQTHRRRDSWDALCTLRCLHCSLNQQKNVLFAGLRWPNTLAWDAITAGTQMKRSVSPFFCFQEAILPGASSSESKRRYERVMSQYLIYIVILSWSICILITRALHVVNAENAGLFLSEPPVLVVLRMCKLNEMKMDDILWIKSTSLQRWWYKWWAWSFVFFLRTHTDTCTLTHAAPLRFHWTAVSWKGCAETLQCTTALTCTSLNMGIGNLFSVRFVCVYVRLDTEK